VSIGLYAATVYTLGLGLPFGELADPRRDEEGQALDLARLPKRARRDPATRVRRPRSAPPATRSAEPVIKIGVLGTMSGPAAPWGLVSKHCAEPLRRCTTTGEALRSAESTIACRSFRMTMPCSPGRLPRVRAS
jgi:hypothetical protein